MVVMESNDFWVNFESLFDVKKVNCCGNYVEDLITEDLSVKLIDASNKI